MSDPVGNAQTTPVSSHGGAATTHTATPQSKAAQEKKRRERSQVVIHSYPKYLYTWPLILMAALFPLLGGDKHEVVKGWIFLGTLVLVLMAIGFDLNRNLTISWVITIIAGVFCALWLDSKHVYLFSDIGHYLANRTPIVSPDWQYLFAMFGGGLYFIMFLDARINQRWRIGRNEIEHFAMLSKDDSLGRGAKRIITSYPDFLELLLCGAGTIQIYSAQGGVLLRSIPNVPLLFFRSDAISRILEATEVSPTGDEETDVQENSANEELGDGHGG